MAAVEKHKKNIPEAQICTLLVEMINVGRGPSRFILFYSYWATYTPF